MECARSRANVWGEQRTSYSTLHIKYGVHFKPHHKGPKWLSYMIVYSHATSQCMLKSGTALVLHWYCTVRVGTWRVHVQYNEQFSKFKFNGFGNKPIFGLCPLLFNIILPSYLHVGQSTLTGTHWLLVIEYLNTL